MRGVFARLISALRRRGPTRPDASAPGRVGRDAVDHVILLDGTMGALTDTQITSIGLVWRFLRRANPRASLYYGKGLQWREWREFADVWLGWGVNRQILRAYGWLAMRYRPGDRIFLIGYSRGGFAARSLAGMIDRVGLLRAEAATERNVRLAWRYYEAVEPRPVARIFRTRFCHAETRIEMVGTFDTVMALGVQLPFLWVLSEPRYRFHDHRLGASVHHGYQALALNETRSVLEPLIWDSAGTGATRIEQVWFRGCHGDIGGQLGGKETSRPLANIPLVWMLERAEALGLTLPPDWQGTFPTDPGAPSVGSWGAWGRYFLFRAPRVVGRDPSERLHESAVGARRDWRTILLPQVLRRRAPPDLQGGAHDETGGAAGGIELAVGHPPDLAARDPG